jgi:predicted lipoprotein with Yx(FWY)xxD motif
VLADEHGMTVYRYICTDDAVDQQLCDYPEAPQIYRLIVCGGGDADRCARTFPYVVAPTGAKTGNQVWGTMYINPKTGKSATATEPGALNVWTLRGRPLYTFAGRNGYGDHRPTDTNGNGWGEFSGRRNGFSVIVFRPAFVNGEG